jgi:hypothetical protein
MVVITNWLTITKYLFLKWKKIFCLLCTFFFPLSLTRLLLTMRHTASVLQETGTAYSYTASVLQETGTAYSYTSSVLQETGTAYSYTASVLQETGTAYSYTASVLQEAGTAYSYLIACQ